MSIERNDQIKQIQGIINDFFGDDIRITPRALSALHGRFRENGEPWERDWVTPAISVFEELIASSIPALSLLVDEGLSVEKLFSNSQNRGYSFLPYDTIQWIFSPGFSSFDFLPDLEFYKLAENIFDKIKKSKRLDEVDLFRSFLCTAYSGPIEFYEAVDTDSFGKYCTDVGDRLINAGLCGPNEVKEYLVEDRYIARSLAAEKFMSLAKKSEKISIFDPSHDLYQYAIWSDQKGNLKIRPFGVGGLGKIAQDFIEDGSKFIYRNGILQPAKSFGQAKDEDFILIFEQMIESMKCSENDFQKFFEKNPEFLAGIDYKHIHPQLVLFNEDGPNLIPDFMLEPLSSEFCDILDLKLPYNSLVKRLKNGTRANFKAFVHESIAQLTEYRRYFDDKHNREKFHKKYGLSAYYPKMIIVVGRRHDFLSDVERQELKQILPKDLDLWTYDDLLNRAKQYLKVFQ